MYAKKLKEISSENDKKERDLIFEKKVTTEGLEPSTIGAEIQYSIQLNYVANLVC